MSDQAQDTTKEKETGHESQGKETAGRYKDSLSKLTHTDEPRPRDRFSRSLYLENTYQLEPTKYFPVNKVNEMLKDVLTTNLQGQTYNPEHCRRMVARISEVIKAQVKKLMIPRYKIVVMVYIGQLNGLSILIGSRCLWDAKTDNIASHLFRNPSLFALANVYAIYHD